jgi:hypothetical protein
MLTRMSETSNSDPPAGESAERDGVLARLPRSRPQRASPRRARARTSTRATNGQDAAVGAGDAPTQASPIAAPARAGKAARPSRARVKAARKPARSPAHRHGRVADSAPDAVPPQGYEADDDSLRGPVRPPGSPELVASAAELAGELAKSGVTAGARLLKDFLSRLPG